MLYAAAQLPIDAAEVRPGGAPAGELLNLTQLLLSVPAYPGRSVFTGRGVVLVAGGPRYTPPAYAALVFLRRAGCALPAEVWTLPSEPMHVQVKGAFARLGAVIRKLDDIYPADARVGGDEQRPLSRFLAKPVAVLSSSFEEVSSALHPPFLAGGGGHHTQHVLVS